MDIPANAKYAIIQETSQRAGNLLSTKQLCSLAGVSRSGYYHYLSTEEDGEQIRDELSQGLGSIRTDSHDSEELSDYRSHAKPPFSILTQAAAKTDSRRSSKSPSVTV